MRACLTLINSTPLSTLYNSLILKGLKFNNFLAKNCKPSIYRALEKRVESQVKFSDFLRAYPRYFEVQERYPNDNQYKVIFVRNMPTDEPPNQP